MRKRSIVTASLIMTSEAAKHYLLTEELDLRTLLMAKTAAKITGRGGGKESEARKEAERITRKFSRAIKNQAKG